MGYEANGTNALPEDGKRAETGGKAMAADTVTVIGNLGGDPQTRLCPLAIAWRISRWLQPSVSRTAAAYGRNEPNGTALWYSGSWPTPARSISARPPSPCRQTADHPRVQGGGWPRQELPDGNPARPFHKLMIYVESITDVEIRCGIRMDRIGSSS